MQPILICTVRNSLIISLLSVLLFHNVFSLYAGAFFKNESQSETRCSKSGQSDELSYKAAIFNVINQFIFDSEFKNINANISVFEAHRNLISEFKSLLSHISALSTSEFIEGITIRSMLLSVQFSIPNCCKQALQINLYSFRI